MTLAESTEALEGTERHLNVGRVCRDNDGESENRTIEGMLVLVSTCGSVHCACTTLDSIN